MNQPILSLHTWVNLPADVRTCVRNLFDIPRSSNVMVNDGKLDTDGTTPEDFKALTVEKMQLFTGETTSDFHMLFDKTLEKIQGDIEEGLPSAFPIEPEITPVTPPKNAKKKNK